MAAGNHSLPSQLISGCDSGFFHCLAQWSNDVTNGFFWVGIIIAFAVVVYMASLGRGLNNTRAFGFASIVGLLASIWMGILQLMPWWLVSLFIVVGLVGMASMIMSER